MKDYDSRFHQQWPSLGKTEFERLDWARHTGSALSKQSLGRCNPPTGGWQIRNKVVINKKNTHDDCTTRSEVLGMPGGSGWPAYASLKLRR